MRLGEMVWTEDAALVKTEETLDAYWSEAMHMAIQRPLRAQRACARQGRKGSLAKKMRTEGKPGHGNALGQRCSAQQVGEVQGLDSPDSVSAAMGAEEAAFVHDSSCC